MGSDALKIIGVAEEDPLNYQTWSGSSAYFFSSLKITGHLVSTISAQPGRLMTQFYKIRNFHPVIEKWKFKYYVDIEFYKQMTRAALMQLHALDSASYNVILQIGAVFDL